MIRQDMIEKRIIKELIRDIEFAVGTEVEAYKMYKTIAAKMEKLCNLDRHISTLKEIGIEEAHHRRELLEMIEDIKGMIEKKKRWV
ncbi:MAG TPA: hypothetical protein ENF81_06130 [Thermotogaceae bacterium]|nr:hypothetical protein [Thermotogaceae bacterium]